MVQSSASYRTIALLALVATATHALSLSRGKLSEVSVVCTGLVLVGLVMVLFWRGCSQTRGGFQIWQVALPCALVYVFATNAGRHLLIASPQDWRPALRLITGIALLAAVPLLLLVLRHIRQRIGIRWQVAVTLLPLLPVLFLFFLVPIVSPAPTIDVFLFQTQAAANLLQGINPYGITFSNVYGVDTLYPSGGPDSYPYPPLSLMFAILGSLFGDVRWTLIACHVVAAGLLFGTAKRRRLPAPEGLILGTMFLYLPHAPFVNEQAWTDPSVAFSLGLMSYLLARRQSQAALWAAGFTLALKQTMILLLPLLWGLWKRLDGRHIPAVFASSGVTYGLFLLWDAGALWNDVVVFHLGTPFRPMSLTLSAYLAYFHGLAPLPAWLSLVGMVVGVAAGVISLRSDSVPMGEDPACDSERVWRLFAGLGFALLLTFVLSKHAFMNYYYLVHFCLLAALVWSRVADHELAAATAAASRTEPWLHATRSASSLGTRTLGP